MLNERRDAESPERADPLEGMHLTRLGEANDVAYAAVYLASRESEFVTGVNLALDGGSAVRRAVDARLTARHASAGVLSAISTFGPGSWTTTSRSGPATGSRRSGISVAKLERFGWDDGTRLVADVIAAGCG